MPTKIECHNVTVGVRAIDTTDDAGRIPDNLAALTQTVIALHRANGDLNWVRDMLEEEPTQN